MVRFAQLLKFCPHPYITHLYIYYCNQVLGSILYIEICVGVVGFLLCVVDKLNSYLFVVEYECKVVLAYVIE